MKKKHLFQQLRYRLFAVRCADLIDQIEVHGAAAFYISGIGIECFFWLFVLNIEADQVFGVLIGILVSSAKFFKDFER
jgi:hypothetical protein